MQDSHTGQPRATSLRLSGPAIWIHRIGPAYKRPIGDLKSVSRKRVSLLGGLVLELSFICGIPGNASPEDTENDSRIASLLSERHQAVHMKSSLSVETDGMAEWLTQSALRVRRRA